MACPLTSALKVQNSWRTSSSARFGTESGADCWEVQVAGQVECRWFGTGSGKDFWEVLISWSSSSRWRRLIRRSDSRLCSARVFGNFGSPAHWAVGFMSTRTCLPQFGAPIGVPRETRASCIVSHHHHHHTTPHPHLHLHLHLHLLHHHHTTHHHTTTTTTTGSASLPRMDSAARCGTSARACS